jgi:Phasin protein
MTDVQSNKEFEMELHNGRTQWPTAETTELWAPLITGTQDWVGRFSSTTYALNKRWLDFLQKRFKEDFALPQRIMSCRTPMELWSAYREFLQEAVTDYQKEFAELGKLGSVAGSEPMTQKPKKSPSRVDEFRRTQTIQ